MKLNTSSDLPLFLPVMILPIMDTDKGAVIGVILVYSGPLHDLDDPCLRILERHISAACKRVHALREPLTLSKLRTERIAGTDNEINFEEQDQKVLQLCGELYDIEATSLQLKIVQYLQRETDSMCCCMLVAAEGDGHLFCQVVGEKVLNEEILFPVLPYPLSSSGT
ncbi:cGMP-dependent 3',5'-cyclic phosphodiesterase-like [Leucoraja erinacea]|uniref:cGMP-dependent 3',5'-cyclic phosphodiesterase-like n=1 Tax=Leucoraja erinaceus TaxID=7782 RepID=UPI0024567629|nr:cGMP-dependent 3',5'-cyclic phosphodiesterase-like [Leucoraja erinacea]